MRVMKSIIVMMIILWGCEEDTNFWDECDRLDQGVVEIHNHTHLPITVDVTWGTLEENDPVEFYEEFNVIYQFQEIWSGEAKVWITFNGKKWLHERVQVTSCEKTPCFINLEDVVNE